MEVAKTHQNYAKDPQLRDEEDSMEADLDHLVENFFDLVARLIAMEHLRRPLPAPTESPTGARQIAARS